MGQIAVFIDGAYLDKVCELGTGRLDLDHQALIDHVCAGHELFRVYYFDSPPYQSNPPTEEESRRTSYKRRFFAHLERLPRSGPRPAYPLPAGRKRSHALIRQGEGGRG